MISKLINPSSDKVTSATQMVKYYSNLTKIIFRANQKNEDKFIIIALMIL